MISQNGILMSDIVSAVFTATPDIRSAFRPAPRASWVGPTYPCSARQR